LLIQVEFCWGQGVEKSRDDLLVDRIGGEPLTHWGVRLRSEIVTQILIPPLVLHRHLVPTAPAIDDTLEQRGGLMETPKIQVTLLYFSRSHFCSPFSLHLSGGHHAKSPRKVRLQKP